MKTLSRASALLIALPILLFSCETQDSVDVNQDSIYGEYRLVYEAASDKTFARATFKFGGPTGTILELSDPADVTSDGGPMGWKPILVWYESESASTDSSVTFVYTDLDNNSFTNEVSLAHEIDFPAGLDTIRQNAAYTLAWEGLPLATNESVIVTINGINEGDAKIFIQNNPATTEIILDKDKLAGIGVGEATIALERYTIQDIQEGTSEGGQLWSRYIAAPIKVQIAP